MYEVMALRRKICGAGWGVMLLAAAFLAVFAYFGWKYAAGEEVVFPVFSRVCARLDGVLEQAAGKGVLETIAGIFHGALFYASAGSF